MIKTLSLIAGLGGAVTLSQAPAFSQQYLQRLAGQVDALSTVRSALAAGLGREEALQQMTGSDFLVARQADMRSTFARHARLADNLTVLRAATPLARLALPHRFADTATLSNTWSDFSPSMPLTSAGAVASAAGGVTGWAAAYGLLSLLSAPFRRSRKVANVTPRPRKEPTLAAAATTREQPRLMGETR